MLHIKPTDIVFEMTVVGWSPDGRQLAVGGDEGEVVVFQVESEEQLPERRGLRQVNDALRHSSAIVAVHWADISSVWVANGEQQVSSQPKLLFQDRAARLLGRNSSRSGGERSVLVTADAQNQIGLWWGGRVLLALVDLSKHLSEEESELVGEGNIRVEQVRLAPDLSHMFVWTRFGGRESPNDEAKGEYRTLALQLQNLQAVCQDADVLARTVDDCSEVLNEILLATRQITTEVR